MNIAYVTSLYPALTETFVAREIQEVVDLGHKVVVCQARPNWKYRQLPGMSSENVRVIRWNWNILALLWANLCVFACRPAAYLRCVRDMLRAFTRLTRIPHVIYILLVSAWIARKLSSENIDHVHCHFLRTEAVGGMWVSRMLGKTFSVTEHTKCLYRARSLSLRAIKDAAFLVVDIDEVHEMIHELADRRSRPPIHFIRNGIKLDELPFRPPEGPRENRIPTLLAIGRLCDYKGFDILIRACAELAARGLAFRCRIIGNGPERANLEKLVRDLHIEGRVELPGEVSFSELRKEYDCASALVVPSRGTELTDGLPTVAIEALAIGIPTIATRWAGIPDLIVDGETGYLAEPGSDSSLTDKIGDMLSATDEARALIASNGREMIERDFDLRANVKRLVSHWENAGNGNSN